LVILPENGLICQGGLINFLLECINVMGRCTGDGNFYNYLVYATNMPITLTAYYIYCGNGITVVIRKNGEWVTM